jgi:hypothetical protein
MGHVRNLQHLLAQLCIALVPRSVLTRLLNGRLRRIHHEELIP